MEEAQLVDSYLHSAHAEDRLRILQTLREKNMWMPISLSADLLKLKLNADEHIAILRSTSAKQRLAFEDYLTSQLMRWDQNVASAALWEWALRTDCIMWHRTLPLSLSPLTPQRMRYTLLDLAWFGGGFPLIQKLVDMDGLEDMSAAFISLLCFRALQFGVASDRVLNLAKRGIEGSYHASSVAEKTLPYFLAYVFRNDPQWAKAQKVNQSFSGIWSQFMNANHEGNRWEKELSTLNQLIGRQPTATDEATIMDNWPSIWDRHHIEAPILCWLFEQLAEKKFPTISEQSWEFFAGVQPKILKDMLITNNRPEVLVLALNVVGPFLDYNAQLKVLDHLKKVLQTVPNAAEILTSLLPRYSALLNAEAGGASVFGKVFDERQQMLAAFNKDKSGEVKGLGLWEKEFPPQDASRHTFFAIAYHDKKLPDPKGDDFWASLIAAWKNPSADRIEALSTKARQAPDLFQICFIDTLGRFHGSDAAALKLLDFIRSSEEPVLRSVIYALQGIGTVRASQELVAFLTRPNVSANLQLEITQLLHELDVSHLQAELRSALNDLNYRTMRDSMLIELRDAISSLLVVEDQIKPSPTNTSLPQQPTTIDLDKLLSQKIDRYEQLSSEVKRALRTAQFFHLQVEQAGNNLGTIDLSPAIDMQYKALELSFREKFEQHCSDLIRQGILQRKLDVIGYARPIPSAMDDFEGYIEHLPIINTIPFFSRFKLRKMLRAICQFRPGKRFTLDGLKAFAIFFICFSRHDCRYGLGKLFHITNMSQDQLLHFCKELHVFQDFRNRAAHEGFHPDASNNLDSIWKSTASIIQGMFIISDGLESHVAKGTIRKIG
ncbi:hypothetical protein [Oligoflexus tunisiensis]|uniref:hypothetical protein n=1 Tax=Oligoflexus tunisiensis TaxID=708132 RepID=UPI00114D34C8|nr:hypothetical protein [Oligoflexus tunisiensis]